MSNINHANFPLKLMEQLTHKFSLRDQKLFISVVHGLNINLQLLNTVLQCHVTSSHCLQ